MLLEWEWINMPNRTNVHNLIELPQSITVNQPSAIVSLRAVFSIPFKCVNKIVVGRNISLLGRRESRQWLITEEVWCLPIRGLWSMSKYLYGLYAAGTQLSLPWICSSRTFEISLMWYYRLDILFSQMQNAVCEHWWWTVLTIQNSNHRYSMVLPRIRWSWSTSASLIW